MVKAAGSLGTVRCPRADFPAVTELQAPKALTKLVALEQEVGRLRAQVEIHHYPRGTGRFQGRDNTSADLSSPNCVTQPKGS